MCAVKRFQEVNVQYGCLFSPSLFLPPFDHFFHFLCFTNVGMPLMRNQDHSRGPQWSRSCDNLWFRCWPAVEIWAGFQSNCMSKCGTYSTSLETLKKKSLNLNRFDSTLNLDAGNAESNPERLYCHMKTSAATAQNRSYYEFNVQITINWMLFEIQEIVNKGHDSLQGDVWEVSDQAGFSKSHFWLIKDDLSTSNAFWRTTNR